MANNFSNLSPSSTGAELALFPVDPVTLTYSGKFFSQLQQVKYQVRIVEHSRESPHKLARQKLAGSWFKLV